jgi:glycerol-3-phosphate dehydrogenase (NAD(P)+)
MNVTVIGAGAWGTALANLLCQNDHAVTLWGHDAKRHLARIRETRDNPLYLPGIALSPKIQFQERMDQAIQHAECVVIAVPSKFFREVTSQIIRLRRPCGQRDQGHRIRNRPDHVRPAQDDDAQSGRGGAFRPDPGLGSGAGIPAAIVAAHPQPETAQRVQALFGRPAFRVYTSQDVAGVELGGAIKNVVALAAGIGDGLGFGDNAKAGLVTRGLAEMRRLGVARGASAETFSGLSGLGDLAATCYSRLSRNRAFGERVGRGEKVESILAGHAPSVAEGYPTARAAFQLARKLGIETPIIDEVHAMLYEGKEVRRAVQDLMSREPKPED